MAPDPKTDLHRIQISRALADRVPILSPGMNIASYVERVEACFARDGTVLTESDKLQIVRRKV
jgi:hypothetical protein